MTDQTEAQDTGTTGKGAGDDDNGQGGDNGSTEARARRMGWVPEEDWQGTPPQGGFRTAEEFIERGETELPILRERLRKSDGQVVELTASVEEMSGVLKDFKTHYDGVEKRAYDKALKEIEEKQRQAVEDSDTAAFDAAEAERKKLDPPKTTSETKKPPGPDDDPAFKAWATENQWYGEDVELTGYADMIAAPVGRKGYKGRALYDQIEAEVRKKFPDSFKNPKRDDPPSVEGGGKPAASGGGSKKHSYANLPAEEKAACDRFVKTIPGFTKEEYVKTYDWSE